MDELSPENQMGCAGAGYLNYHGWYLVAAIIKSWVDIFVMQHLLTAGFR